MPTVITKKSTVAAKVPLSTDLQVGELAVNTADKKLYSKHSDNSVVEIGFNPAVPGPIGSVTPNTVASTGLTVTGGTVTTSTPVISCTQTWNGAGVTFEGIKFAASWTAASTGRFIDIYGGAAGTTSVFRVTANALGESVVSCRALTPSSSVQHSGNGFMLNTTGGGMAAVAGFFGIGGDIGASNPDVRIYKSAANVAKLCYQGSTVNCDLNLRNLISTGSISTGLSSKTADYTLTAYDGTITADSTSAAITLTLETAVGHTRIHAFKKTAGVNLVTIDGNASETIDGATSITLTDRCILQSNGTNWIQIA